MYLFALKKNCQKPKLIKVFSKLKQKNLAKNWSQLTSFKNNKQKDIIKN